MKQRKIIALLLAVAVLFSTSICAIADDDFLPEAQTPQNSEIYTMTDDGEMAKTLVRQAASYILQKYKFDTSRAELYESTLMKLLEDNPELTEQAFKAMFGSLDKHTAYYTQEEYDYFTQSMSGSFCGIGVTISETNYGLVVTEVISNSPAKDAGLRVGDVITTANDVNIVGMPITQAREYIVGEEGTTVVIGLMRGEEYLKFCVERRPVAINPGMYQVVEDNIGYLYIEEFDLMATALVDEALDYFDQRGITNIIVDLRYNPGGAVSSLDDVCQRIIPEGPIMHFEYKNPLKNVTIYSECKNPKYKVIVLANGSSASASEAFCGAVQDSGIGIVLGTTTYGKGTMQNMTDFKVGGGVKLTEAEYLTRGKRHINGKGIEPDVDVVDGVVSLEKSGFENLDFENVYTIGSKGPVVLAINQRLWALGYDVGLPTDEYTQKTFFAISNFQKASELFPYGECDISTQLALENIMQTYEIPDNASFKEAVKIFKEGTIDKLKVDWLK